MRGVFGIGLAAVAALLLLALIDLTRPVPALKAVSARTLRFSALPGWEQDAVERALPVFLRSCAKIEKRSADAPFNPLEQEALLPVPTLSGRAGDWQPLCAEARALAEAGAAPQEVRAFFETRFLPVELRAPASLFTGYFEPSYPARRTPSGGLDAPVLTVPGDLVTADLGAFHQDLKGRDLVGRVKGGRLVPYPDHAAIASAPPEGAEALGYVDPNDLLFLQIQGSGRLVFEDGEVLRAGYAGKNGRAYVPVGRTLVQMGAMPLEKVSMASIRRWLAEAPPEAAARVRHSNPSYVFFRPLDLAEPGLGPLGAQGVQLTAMRSLAVDRRYYPMGAPVFVVTEGSAANPPLSRLMVAQDTGGAIRGPVRGDVFFGAGEEAAALAGTMKAEGRLFVLLPKRLAESWDAASS